MKKILFMAVSAVLLAAGCQKTEIVNPVGEPAMKFTTGMSKITKAAEGADANADGYENLDAQDFKLWAYTAYVDSLNGVTIGEDYDDMLCLHIGYAYTPATENTEASGVCTTTKDYYWPGTGKDLDFFAISTAETWKSETQDGLEMTVTNLIPEGEDAAADMEKRPAVTDRTMVLTGYTVNPEDPNDDLMVADFVRQNQSHNGKNVPLNFRHTLSKIQFLFKTNMKMGVDDETGEPVELPLAQQDTVLVQSIVVENVKNTGKLTVNPSANETENATVFEIVPNWTEQQGTAEFKDDYDITFEGWKNGEAHKVENTEGAKVPVSDIDQKALLLTGTATEFATWLVIPQTIKDESTALKVKVTYIINSRQFEEIFPLYTEELTSWETNQYVKYTVTLTPNKIGFAPSVTPWDEADEIDMNN